MNQKIEHRLPPRRAKMLSGTTPRYKTGCGWVYITINVDDSGYPVEVFAHMGKSGGCGSAILESIGRLISVSLRCDVDAAELASQLVNIECPNKTFDEGIHITSCPSAIGQAVKDVLAKLEIPVTGTVDDIESKQE